MSRTGNATRGDPASGTFTHRRRLGGSILVVAGALAFGPSAALAATYSCPLTQATARLVTALPSPWHPQSFTSRLSRSYAVQTPLGWILNCEYGSIHNRAQTEVRHPTCSSLTLGMFTCK